MTAATAPAHQPDNLFGICHRIGEDFRFDPLWLRIGLAAGFVLAPVAVILGYFAMGGFVLLSRLLFPAKARASADVMALPARAAGAAPELAQAA